jgi:hypothetical protein
MTHDNSETLLPHLPPSRRRFLEREASAVRLRSSPDNAPAADRTFRIRPEFAVRQLHVQVDQFPMCRLPNRSVSAWLTIRTNNALPGGSSWKDKGGRIDPSRPYQQSDEAFSHLRAFSPQVYREDCPADMSAGSGRMEFVR